MRYSAKTAVRCILPHITKQNCALIASGVNQLICAVLAMTSFRCSTSVSQPWTFHVRSVSPGIGIMEKP